LKTAPGSARIDVSEASAVFRQQKRDPNVT
jgi:hypothetical protein